MYGRLATFCFCRPAVLPAPPIESPTTVKKLLADSTMRRLFLGLVAVAALAACSDSNPTGTRASGANLGIRGTVIDPAPGTLDAQIIEIIGFWPDIQEADLLQRWEAIKKLYQQGQTKPKSLQDAINKLLDMSKQVVRMTGKMGDPTTGESQGAAAARLIEYMNLYIFGGPNTDPPPYDPDSESAVGFLTPNSSLTLVLPNGHGGVNFGKGSVNNNRTIVVTEDPVHYGPCDGPLLTELCQYPLYLDIASYPDGPLLKIAQAEVCHPPEGTFGGPPDEATHDRLRLAHTAPSDADDYVTGGTVRITPVGEENIEILPLISQTFLPSCEDITWENLTDANFLERGVRLASALASRVVRFLTPRSAYAIDQGGGGPFLDFSPFNNVDPGEEGPTGPTGCEFEC
jgi:hypothetical protein